MATPITIRNLWYLRPPRFAARMPTILAPLCTAALAALVAVTLANGALYRHLGWPDWGFGSAESGRYPEHMLERLRTLEGNIWNSSDLGGYLIWKLWPDKQVGIDGRWEVYGELLPELRKAYSDPDLFDRLVEAYDIRAVVLARNTTETRQMLPWLSRRKDWVLKSRGMQAFLFERRKKRTGRR